MIRPFALLCLLQAAASAADLNEWGDGAAEHEALAVFTSRLPDIHLHFHGELAKPPQSLEMMMGGELDLVSGGLENFMPLIIDEITGLTMPFLLPDSVSTSAYLASPLMDEGREKVLHSRAIRFLTFDGLREPSRLIFSVKPVRSAQDLAGLTVLVLPGPSNAGVRVWKQLGVTVAPSSTEMSLVPGKLDAIIVSEPDRIPVGSRYMGEIHDRPDLWTIAIREAMWQSWSPALREAAMAAASEASKALTRKGEKQRAALLKQAKAKGIETGQVDALSIHRQLEPLYNSFIEYGDINPRVLQTAREVDKPKP